METLPHVMAKENIDVALLQETKKPSDTLEIDGYYFFLHGEEKEKRAGVAIVLSPRAFQAWHRAGRPEPIRINCADAGRIIGLHLTFLDHAKRNVRMFVVSAHLPHSGYSDDAFLECFEKIEKLIDDFPEDVIPHVGADLNAQLGIRSDSPDFSDVIGPYGIKGCNPRGQKALQILTSMGLRSATSYFPAKSYWSWTSIKDGR